MPIANDHWTKIYYINDISLLSIGEISSLYMFLEMNLEQEAQKAGMLNKIKNFPIDIRFLLIKKYSFLLQVC